jgi:hypothetical protein
LIAFDRDDAGDRAADVLAKKLLAAGLDCFRLKFPKGMDANAYACAVKPREKSLGVVIRSAEWLGAGAKPKLTTRCFNSVHQWVDGDEALRAVGVLRTADPPPAEQPRALRRSRALVDRLLLVQQRDRVDQRQVLRVIASCASSVIEEREAFGERIDDCERSQESLRVAVQPLRRLGLARRHQPGQGPPRSLACLDLSRLLAALARITSKSDAGGAFTVRGRDAAERQHDVSQLRRRARQAHRQVPVLNRGAR